MLLAVSIGFVALAGAGRVWKRCGIDCGIGWTALLDRQVGGTAESFTWLTVANSLGIATGSVVLEAVVDHWNAGAAFLLASWAPLAAVVVRGTRLVVQSLCGLGLVGRGPL